MNAQDIENMTQDIGTYLCLIWNCNIQTQQSVALSMYYYYFSLRFCLAL